jgi:hypothetical protein
MYMLELSRDRFRKRMGCLLDALVEPVDLAFQVQQVIHQRLQHVTVMVGHFPLQGLLEQRNLVSQPSAGQDR